MKSLKNKILLGFATILTLLLIVSAVTVFNLMKMNATVEKVVSEDVELLIAQLELGKLMQERVSLVRGYLITGEEDYKDRFFHVTERSIAYQELISELNPSEEARLLMEQSIEWRWIINDSLFPAFERGDTELAFRTLNNVITPLARQIDEGFTELANNEKAKVEWETSQLINEGKQVELFIIGTVIVALLLGGLIAVLIANCIVKPILKVVSTMKNVADGNLRGEKLVIKSKDEIGQLIDSLNEMVEGLSSLVKQVSVSSEHMAASSEELSASSEQSNLTTEQISSSIQQLATGAGNQVEFVKESVTTIKQLSDSAKQIANNSLSVTATVETTAQTVEQGNSAIHNTVEKMNSIHSRVDVLSSSIKVLNDSSKQINQIVEVITSISDQTNLLALNASIEAARAGEHGKGFAVVAAEVRNLAEQSKQSSQGIAHLVKTIQEEMNAVVKETEMATVEVEEGIDVVRCAGESFNEIKDSIQNVNKQIKRVSLEVEEMSAGTNQVFSALQDISQVSEESAASTQSISAAAQQQLASIEEVAASANALAQMSEELQMVINRFKV